MYQANANKIEFHAGGDADLRATCTTLKGAETAVDRLNRAIRANDARKYTMAARLNAAAEDIDGFRWIEAS